VEDLARAVEEVVAMGGRIVSPPGAPMPASPDLEWAVMADPFGNEFCLVQERAYDT
jgi:predicted enzyme related to lactoylglutathione lyase